VNKKVGFFKAIQVHLSCVDLSAHENRLSATDRAIDLVLPFSRDIFLSCVVELLERPPRLHPSLHLSHAPRLFFRAIDLSS